MADYQRISTVGPPSSPVRGAIYIDATNGLGWYDGTEWVYPGSGGGGGGTVDSVVAGTDINVDDTDAANPVVSVPGDTFDAYGTSATETTRAEAAEALLAPKASPTFTGTPAAPTASALTDSTQIATTAYADTAVGVETSRAETAEALLAPKASPALTGTPTAPTASALTDSTQVATTAYADTAVGVEKTRALAAEALLLPLAGGTMSGAIAMGSHKVTGLTDGSSAQDAAAFHQIPTEIDGNLTLGGKPVSAVPPTSGGPYALAWNGTDWVPETFAAGPSGTPAGGDKLMTDSSGNSYWVDDTNDALQFGFVGITNPGIVSMAIAGGGALTATNWPTSDLVWLSSGSRPQRFVCPSYSTQTVTGVTSGDWAYVYVQLVSPANPGGSPTLTLHVGTSRTTAALAAADQVANTSGNIVWDGVVKNTSGTYTLTGGTPASGSVIPSAGRDRRLWARGGHSKVKRTSGDIDLPASIAYLDSSGLAIRAECSGVPVRLRLVSGIVGASAMSTYLGFRMDGTAVDSTADGSLWRGSIFGSNTYVPVNFFYEFTPNAGSHLFQPTGFADSTSGTPHIFSDTTLPLLFVVEEVLRQDANNGTA